MARRTLTVLTIGMLLAAACGGSGDGAQSTTTRLTLLPTTTVAPTTTAAPTTSSTSTTSTTSTTTTTTSTVAPDTTLPPNPAVNALVLSDDGIGSATFSSEPEGVISFLSSFLGGPTADTGWVDPFEIGACSGTELRLVSWGSLTLTFGDVSVVLQGRRHFFAWEYGDGTAESGPPTGLRTAGGVTVGTSLIALEGVFPNLLLNPADEFVPNNFTVNDNFRGYLTGLADDSTVSRLFGGQGCGLDD